MTILRHIYRHRLHGMVAIQDRKTLQSGNMQYFQFNFTGDNANVYLRDGFHVRNGIRIHTGIESTTIIEGDPKDNLSLIIESIMAQLLGLISFTTVASSGDLALLAHIIITDDNTTTVDFLSYPLSAGELIMGTPRTINQEIFAQVWHNWDKNLHKERLIRACSWFAKGLNEEQSIDQFISYWISMEILSSILRRNLMQKVRNPSAWEAVKEIFNKYNKTFTFDNVCDARSQLLHGFAELTPEFLSRIRSYVAPIRTLALRCISNVLELPPECTDRIVSLKPRRKLEKLTLETSGAIRGLPDNLSELYKQPLELECNLEIENHKLEDDGNLKVDYKTTQTCVFAKNVEFSVNSIRLIGHPDAGIEDVKLK